MEFEKVKLEGFKGFYWTWLDYPYFPYSWLDEKDLKTLPNPFFLEDIHPDCPVGFISDDKEKFTNIISLPANFEELKIDKDLRKDLRRVESKNSDLKLIFNEKNALDKSKKWFLELWKENKKDFARRLKIWKKITYTISAYLENELIAVHIAMQEKKIIYYFGCWWNRQYKNRSVPTFLLKKDIESAIKKKMKFYDLEVGDEPYKKKWGVIEKPTKYYAIFTKEMADHLKIDKYVEMKSS